MSTTLPTATETDRAMARARRLRSAEAHRLFRVLAAAVTAAVARRGARALRPAAR